MNILRSITYVLASAASICVIVASIYGYLFVQGVGEALKNFGTPATVTAPATQLPTYTGPAGPGMGGEGLSDEDYKATLDPACVKANPNTWAVDCAS